MRYNCMSLKGHMKMWKDLRSVDVVAATAAAEALFIVAKEEEE
jgi:hypothetical protein